jgi:acyl-CoA synthetase (NDP forming)
LKSFLIYQKLYLGTKDVKIMWGLLQMEEVLVCLPLTLLEKENIKTLKPIDLMGDALARKYEQALEDLLKRKNIYCAYVLQGPQIMTEPEKTAKVIVKLKKKYQKPIIVSFIGGDFFKSAIHIIEKNKIPNFREIKRAVNVIKYLIYEK